MPKPITNAHIHVFDARCAPDRFFLVLPVGVVRLIARPLRSFLMSQPGIDLINGLAKWTSTLHDKGKISRFLAFTKIGAERSQDDVFQMALKAGKQYDASVRLIGLTLNMDYMDSEPSDPLNYKNYATQLEEVKNIKRNSPRHFFPFLCIDPRHKTGTELRDWVRDQLTDGFEHKGKLYPYFYGLKIYPALGFFPFDPALEEVYAYAEEYGIPIMTHCTRGGSQYIGKHIQQLIPKEPAVMLSTSEAAKAFGEIKKRIDEYYEKGWIKNNSFGNNDKACDLFTHPQNYIPVLEKFPKLKICIAHMGGEGEFYTDDELHYTNWLNQRKAKNAFKDLAEIRGIDKERWVDHLQRMMCTYTSLFTDISYTVSYFENARIVVQLQQFANAPDLNKKPLGHRILFGTDFFMTEREKKEGDLYGLMIRSEGLKDWVDGFCRENVEGYVGW
jgi:uncharacterized protein